MGWPLEDKVKFLALVQDQLTSLDKKRPTKIVIINIMVRAGGRRFPRSFQAIMVRVEHH